TFLDQYRIEIIWRGSVCPARRQRRRRCLRRTRRRDIGNTVWPMAILLVTGMSGTGKSTALAELARRGHRVVDTDDAGWSENVPTAEGGIEQLWREDEISALLAEPSAGS